MPRLSQKPLDQQTDKQLHQRYWAIFTKCCDMYGVSSFDQPTLRVLYPDEFAQMQEVVTEGKKRIAATGTFNGVQYDKVTYRQLQEAK